MGGRSLQFTGYEEAPKKDPRPLADLGFLVGVAQR